MGRVKNESRLLNEVFESSSYCNSEYDMPNSLFYNKNLKVWLVCNCFGTSFYPSILYYHKRIDAA